MDQINQNGMPSHRRQGWNMGPVYKLRHPSAPPASPPEHPCQEQEKPGQQRIIVRGKEFRIVEPQRKQQVALEQNAGQLQRQGPYPDSPGINRKGTYK